MEELPESDSTPLLLTTKFYVSRSRPNWIVRERLLQRLDQGMATGRILVSGPAGFGKSILLESWLTECQGLEAWISLDSGDNDPVRFFGYLIAALQSAVPTIGVTARAALQSANPQPAETLMTLLINDLCGLSQRLILVLDDYHWIENPVLHRALTLLCDRLPPHLCLVLATRADPPLPLARWRSRGQLLEIRADDLRFTADEAAQFLNQVMGLGLAADEVSLLEERTEGWIAGLQMAALSLQRRSDVKAFIQAFSGSHRYILDYLMEEVLGGQSEPVQAFLLRTSVLERLSGPLCDAVLEVPAGQGQIFLEGLESANLFIVPLDDERSWYRYHHLFADLLRARLRQLEPGLVTDLHRRASLWYEAHHFPIEAVDHALAAGDASWAAELIERITPFLHSRGEITTLMNWVAVLPLDVILPRPTLVVIRAWVAVFNSSMEAMESLLAAAEAAWPNLPPAVGGSVYGHVLTLRAFVADRRGDYQQAMELATAADQFLPEEEALARSFFPYIQGRTLRVRGELTGAERCAAIMRQLGEATDNNLTVALAVGEQTETAKVRGQLRRAEELYQTGFMLGAPTVVPFSAGLSDALDAVIAELLGIGWSDLLYERGRLDEAQEWVDRVRGRLPAGEWWGIPYDFPLLFFTRVRLVQVREGTAAAWRALTEAEQTLQIHGVLPRGNNLLNSWRVRLWLAEGRLADAVHWAEDPLHQESPVLFRDLSTLTLARINLAQGRADMALRRLESLAVETAAGERWAHWITARTLTAMALASRGEDARALGILEGVLRRAEPEGYMRIFVDEGEQIQVLLAALARRPELAGWDYLARLQQAGKVTPASGGGLLSERELEVLRLLAAGLSNSEIASRLIVTVGTVKTHVHHIYGKLEAQNRAQAVTRATELGLL